MPYPDDGSPVITATVTSGTDGAIDALTDAISSTRYEPEPPDIVCLECGLPFSDNDRDDEVAGYCPNCVQLFYTCDDCHSVRRLSVERPTELLGEWVNICPICIRRVDRYGGAFYRYCDDCEGYYRRDDRDDHDHYGDPDEDEDDGDSRIHSYGYKPRPEFNHTTGITHYELPGHVYVGFELEMEAEGRATIGRGVDAVDDSKLASLVYLKHDGSLYNGMEMVSHPMTLDFAHKLASEDGFAVIEDLRQNGWRSWNSEGKTCGIHVHVNRSAFTMTKPSIDGRWVDPFGYTYGGAMRLLENNSHLWRFTQLIVSNQRDATRFAGRPSCEYATFRGQRKVTSDVICKQKGRGGYRAAVNLGNHSTIEVRMFRGSMLWKRLLADLEFVVADVEYTRGLTANSVLNGALEWSKFVGWANAHYEEYPYLCAVLAHHEPRSAA